MLQIKCDEWISLNRLMRMWADELADGTRDVDLWADVCRAFNNGLLDEGGGLRNGPRYLLLDKVGGRVLSPKDPQLWRYVRPLGDRIVVSKEAVHDLALWCNRTPPSCCADVTKGASQPSRPPGQLAPASEAMIIDDIRSEYHRAEAAGEKPPNIKEVSPPVQVALEHKGYRASGRQIEKLAEAEEFKRLRWLPGKRRREPRKK
jgi:hypothetical protein